MRKFLSTLTAIIIATSTFAQTNQYTFSCQKAMEDYQEIINLKKTYGSQHKQWAMDLSKKFPLDQNNTIHLEYVINCDTTFDVQQIMEISVDWFNYSFSSAAAAIKNCDYEHNVIVANGTYRTLAEYNYTGLFYAKTVTISADIDVIIRFKDNRIKIEIIIRHYHIISGDSMMNSKNSLVGVGDVFPFNTNGTDEIAYARAFINSYANSFDKVVNYIEFLNNNVNKSIIEDNDNW